MAGEGDKQPAALKGTNWPLRIAKWALGLVLGLALIVIAALYVLDTGVGHRFIVQRIAALAPASGLKISIGRIDGSIYSVARIRDLRVSDNKGLIFSSPDVLLDWTPL